MQAVQIHPASGTPQRVIASSIAARLPANLASWLDDTRVLARCNPQAIDACLDQLEELLAQIQGAPAAPTQAVPAGGLAPWQVRRVRKFIEANLTLRLTTADLAAQADLSENHFARAFKISLGAPPHAFVVARRVSFAKTLMLQSDLPLSQVALDAGLADQAHLSRLFQRFVGATPSAWRRQQRQHLADAAGWAAPGGSRRLGQAA